MDSTRASAIMDGVVIANESSADLAHECVTGREGVEIRKEVGSCVRVIFTVSEAG